MQAGGVDWSIIRFVGTDRAFELVKEGRRQEGLRQERQEHEERHVCRRRVGSHFSANGY